MASKKTSTKISLKEIARMADVSVATVSRVINNNGRFSAATRTRVLKIIAATGYKTNTLAKGLRMNRSNSIGILVPDLTNEFFSQVVQQIETNLFGLGFSTIICDTQRDTKLEEYYLNTLEAKSIDGLIVISGTQPFDSSHLSESIPVLCIDREPKNDDTFFISSDHETGALIATQRLIDKGYKPVLVSEKHESTSKIARIAGFRKALQVNGLSIDDSNFFELPHQEEQSHESSLQKFLAANRNKHLGLFCLGDFLAALTLRQAVKLDIQIPKEFGVVGFDDTTFAKLVTPSLTTVHQDIGRIAELSAQTITKLIANPDADLEKKVLVPVTLVARESA